MAELNGKKIVFSPRVTLSAKPVYVLNYYQTPTIAQQQENIDTLQAIKDLAFDAYELYIKVGAFYGRAQAKAVSGKVTARAIVLTDEIVDTLQVYEIHAKTALTTYGQQIIDFPRNIE